MNLSTLLQGWPLFLALGVFVLAVLAFVFLAVRKSAAQDLLVQRRSRLLNATQRQFFDALQEALGDDYFVFTRVGILGVVEHKKGASWFDRLRATRQLSNSYFDYVLCDQQSMSIFAVIELQNFDNQSQRARKKRERLLGRVCQSANVKLFYFDIRQDYRSKDIARLITGKTKRERFFQEEESTTHQSRLSVETRSQSVTGHNRVCPKCRSEVVTKVAVKGKRIGEKFLMCRKFPYCDYQVSTIDENYAKLEQEEIRKSQVKGFKDWS